MMFLCFGTASYAESECPFANGESEYCDESWHGLSAFISFLNQTGRSFRYMNSIDRSRLYHDRSEYVYIWIHPTDMDWEVLDESMHHGTRFLILDESIESLYWFQKCYHKTVFMTDSPDDPTAAHINDKKELPVFQSAQLKPYTPQIRHNWQIAFNHPTPLRLEEDDRGPYVYSWSWPRSEWPGLWVIRDESFIRQIMLKTLENQKYLNEVLYLLCPDNDCIYVILEPSAASETDNTVSENDLDDDSWQNENRNEIKAWLSDVKENVKKSIDYRSPELSDGPWKLIITCVLILWLIMIVLITIQVSRRKDN